MTKNKPDVQIIRQEAFAMRDKYAKIADAIEGEEAVKLDVVTTSYLPVPSSCKEEGGENSDRYKAYKIRALYYNVCQPTRDALVGQLFLRPPVIELPDELSPLVEDMNGEGLNLEQLVRKAASHVLPYGRGGFLADFTATRGEVTKQQLERGEARPIIRFFEPWSIRNWRIQKVGTKHKLTMLVLDEMREDATDENEFDIVSTLHQRVYRLQNESCSVEVYNEDGDTVEKYDICGSDGQALKEIPFEFIGSENNDAEIDEPPFLNLATINLAHYRNSADYEEGVFLCGQPTPVYAGITESWMDNYFPKSVPFGSRVSITLNEGGTAQLLQALPNMVAFEAMEHKEDQMFSIGAKIINPDQKVEKKEAEVEIEAASQKSVLTTIKNNIELALFACVKRAGVFIDVEVTETDHRIELNANFDLTSMNADEIRTVIELVSLPVPLLTRKEARESLKRSGLAKDEEEFDATIEQDLALRKKYEPEQPTVGTVKPNPESTKKEPN